MAEHRTQGLADIQVNTDSLYREEVYTDLNAVTLRRLLPVTAAGEPDPERDPIFLGEASIMTHLGPMPLSFPIQAASLEEACALFPWTSPPASSCRPSFLPSWEAAASRVGATSSFDARALGDLADARPASVTRRPSTRQRAQKGLVRLA